LSLAVLKYNIKQTLIGDISLPASKSISNRLLMLNVYSGSKIEIKGISQASDTICLSGLLAQINLKPSEQNHPLILDAGDTGTAYRFILPLLAITPGWFILTGSERMKKRPVGEMVRVLNTLGADISFMETENLPPLEIMGKEIPGGEIEIDASVSSQFISALLMLAPVLKHGIHLHLQNEIASQPYIEMTLWLMEKLGVKISETSNSIKIDSQDIVPASFGVGKDWSAAASWFAMVSLSDGADLFLKGLKTHSIQGDAILMAIFAVLGVETIAEQGGIRLKRQKATTTDFEFDFFHYPDLVPAVAVSCAALNIPAKLTGIRNLRIKESDRIEALQVELNKIGFNVSSNYDTLFINSVAKPINISQPINTYNDHRIAMAFAPLAVRYGTILINDPQVVSKSYPGFWEEMGNAGIDVSFKE